MCSIFIFYFYKDPTSALLPVSLCFVLALFPNGETASAGERDSLRSGPHKAL